MIAIIAILAGMLLPALAKAKAKAHSISCLNNVKQLITAAQLYSLDNADRWPANGSGSDSLNLANPPATHIANVWVEGREDSNLTDERSVEGMISDKVSLIAPLIKNKKSFRCPADRKIIRVAGKTYPSPRSYGMNGYMGWQGAAWSSLPDPLYRVFIRTSDVTQPANFFVFGEIHPFSICRPMFGVRMTGSGVYHVPGNNHGKTTSFAMADGHAESHRWINSKFHNPGRPETDGMWHNHNSTLPGVSANDIAKDMNWLRTHTTERK